MEYLCDNNNYFYYNIHGFCASKRFNSSLAHDNWHFLIQLKLIFKKPYLYCMKFVDSGLREEILEALYYMGFEEATPVQAQAIPTILAGRDLLACAQTGTGKTGAFILPTLHKLIENPPTDTTVLIMAPTRELALQIDQELEGFTYYANVGSIAIYGGGSGEDWTRQKNALDHGTEIVVATPGKLLSFLNLGYLHTDSIKYLILDEADRMLDIGFYEDIMQVVRKLKNREQTMLFSATMPPKIKNLAKQLLTNPDEITIAISKPAAGVLQAVYLAHEDQKIPLLQKLIADKPNYQSILIFSSTKKKVSEIVRSLKRKNMNVEGISSNLEQKEREAVLSRFRSKNTRILVGTDVISRGIDIKDINLVINYDVPNDAEDYVHRIGRTARANTTGVAITLVHEDDMYNFSNIEKLIEQDVMKIPLPPELGTGPVWEVKTRKPYRKNYSKNKGKGRGGKKRYHRR